MRRDTKQEEIERNGGYESSFASYNNLSHPLPPNVFLRHLSVYASDATNASNLIGQRIFNSPNQFRNWEARLMDQLYKSGYDL